MVCLLEFVDSGGRGVCDCICSGQGYDDFFFFNYGYVCTFKNNQ